MTKNRAPIFRQEAVEAQRTPPISEIVLVRPVSATVMMCIALCAALAVVLFLIFGSYARCTTVEGIIVPDKGLVKIYLQQAGTVMKRVVTEGQRVRKGDILYTVSTDLRSMAEGETQAALVAQVREYKKSLQEEREKLQHMQQQEKQNTQEKLVNLRTQLARINDQIATQQTRISLAKDVNGRYQQLLARNYITHEQFQVHQDSLLNLQSDLISFERDQVTITSAIDDTTTELMNLDLKQKNQLSQIERSIIDSNTTLIALESRREIAATAPVDGTVTATLAETGQSVDTQRPVATIIPDNVRWQARLYVPSGDIGFIKKSDAVSIRYQAFPWQKFGQYQAKVSSIALAALSAVDLSREELPALVATSGGKTFYRVTVNLDQQSVSIYGVPQPLQAGMLLEADIVQEHRHIYEWMLEPVFSLTGKM